MFLCGLKFFILLSKFFVMKAKGRARLLRAAQTAEEKQLWDTVKNRGLGPVSSAISDYVCISRGTPLFYC